MIQKVELRPKRFEGVHFDGSVESFEEIANWVKKYRGEAFTKDGLSYVFSSDQATYPLEEGSWVIRVDEDVFVVMTKTDFFVKYTVV